MLAELDGADVPSFPLPDPTSTLAGDAPARPPRVPPPAPQGATAWLLGETTAPAWSDEARRFAAGLGLAALYGIALGAREGGSALASHAAVVPLALLAIAALGVPALYIALLVFDAPAEPLVVARAGSRAAAKTGLVLAGLAPAAALYVVSSDAQAVAATAGAVGLAVAGTLGLGTFLRDVSSLRDALPAARRSLVGLVLAGFALFATALALRVWLGGLAILGGAS